MGKEGHTMIGRTNRQETMTRFKNIISSINADVWGVCEYAPFFSLKADGEEDMNDVTREVLFSDYPYFISDERSYKNCNAIFSKKVKLSDYRKVKYSNGKARGYIVASVNINNTIVKIVETHFDTSRYMEYREIQKQELIEAFANEDYVIICGDFNVTKISEYDQFSKYGFKMANLGKFGNLVTFRADNVGYYLDNILFKGFDPLSVMVYDTQLSDHYAIICDLIIN